jgi:hypothetical protein
MTSQEIQILSNYAAKERARIQLEIESTLKKGCDLANANKLMQLCDSRFFVGQMTELLKSLTPDDCSHAKAQSNFVPSVKFVPNEEFYLSILRGLISYHERMTMRKQTPYDPYLEALRFAYKAAEEKISNTSKEE